MPRIGAEYFTPEALELCRSLKGRKAEDLSDDEIVLFALTAAQAALVKHVEPGHRDAGEALDTILSVLDHQTIVNAEMRKLHALQVQKLFDEEDVHEASSKS
jgi:hypothetical protein